MEKRCQDSPRKAYYVTAVHENLNLGPTFYDKLDPTLANL
jgi:hypothetical protein